MSDGRRYRNHEIREILELAERDDEPQLPRIPGADGLTASELEEVGREVGFAPGQVARAVTEYEGRGQPAPRSTTLGMPTGVGRMVSLPRAPTDQEWELLVAELRTTFGGKGELTSHGGMREWSHGGLHGFIEPTESGYRFRLTDTMEGAIGATFLGGFFLAFALLIFVVLLGKDDPGFRFFVPGFFSVIGAALIAAPSIALPRWADRRENQMQHVMGRARALIDSAPSTDIESDSG
jgi:hypothetical protein